MRSNHPAARHDGVKHNQRDGDQGSVRLSAMAGLARSRLPGFSEVGYSLGTRLSVALGGALVASGSSFGSQPGTSLFLQADSNATGTIRTNAISVGIKQDF